LGLELRAIEPHEQDGVRFLVARPHQVAVPHAHRAKAQGVVVGKGPRRHPGASDRDAPRLAECPQLLARLFPQNTVAGQHQGSFRRSEERAHLLQSGRRSAPRLYLGRSYRLTGGLHPHDILWHLKHHRPRPFPGGQGEGPAYRCRHIPRTAHVHRPLGDGTEQCKQVQDLLLRRVPAGRPRLRHQGHQRQVAEMGVSDAGRKVRGPRPERAHAYARPPGEPAHRGGHERGGLLMPGEDEFHPPGMQVVHQVHVLLTGNAEGPVHALCPKAVHKQPGRSHLITRRPSPFPRRALGPRRGPPPRGPPPSCRDISPSPVSPPPLFHRTRRQARRPRP